MRSPYSPLFTSGLLSESSNSRPSSRAASVDNDERALPTRAGSVHSVADAPKSAVVHRSFHKMMSPTDEASAFYFTLQPRRDSAEFRSFLSLDLAESSSLRSASLRRKASDASRFASMSSGSRSRRRYVRQSSKLTLEDVPVLPPLPSILGNRRSRDSLRSVPSPKPPPSIRLPELPGPTLIASGFSKPPVLPPLPPSPCLPNFSTLFPSELKVVPPSPPKPKVTVVTTREQPPGSSLNRKSLSITSSFRNGRRESALAHLEGRSPTYIRSPISEEQSNFIQLSDDDDEDLLEDITQHIRDLEVEDEIIPPSPLDRNREPVSWLSTASSSEKSMYPTSIAPAARKNYKKAPAGKEYLRGLTNFVDFFDDEVALGHMNWRTGIEVIAIS